MLEPLLFAVAIVLASPLGVRAADLVVWWEKGYYAQANEAVAELVVTFEQKTGEPVELVQPAQDGVLALALLPLPAPLSAERPGAPAPHPAAAIAARPGAAVARSALVAVVPAVLDPLQRIAMHVVQAPGIRRIGI